MKQSAYTVKNRLWTVILGLYILIALTGCGSIQVTGYTTDPLYYRDCGPNGKFSPRDKECRHHREPLAQSYAVQEINYSDNWRNRPDILEWCRRIQNPKIERRCQGMPGM